MYRKIKSTSHVMYTPDGSLVSVNNADYLHWLSLNNATEEQYPPRVEEILRELDLLDLKAIRPMLENDTARIEEIKTQKATLKAELDTY